MLPLLFGIASVVSTFLGGLFGIRHRDKLHLIISFTAGVLLSLCFFDIIPEIFTLATENGFNVLHALIALVVGFLVIHVLEKAAVIHGTHEDEYGEHRHEMVGTVGALGLSFHSFLDGVGIGLGFHVNQHVGILIAIAVIAHDFSDGLNTVSYMLLNKNSMKKTITLLTVDAFAPIIGVLATVVITIPKNMLMIYLGFFAGFLLYISASDLLPEAHSKKSSWRLVGLTILGVVFMFVVTRLT
ncbi:MAG: ZIP family metal transporter [bacterium]|nr:ZIP family metal transporter [bacterium]